MGQVVGGGSAIAQIVGTDALWVSVSVPVSKIRDLGLTTTANNNTTATVRQRLGNTAPITYPAQVLRLGGQLDPQTRHAEIIIAVDQPFDVAPQSVPLLPGAYVEVELAGRPLDQVFQIPRSAVYEGNRIWIATDGKLVTRQVVIESGNEDTVLVSEGLSNGDALVTSALSLPVPGMPVQVVN